MTLEGLLRNEELRAEAMKQSEERRSFEARQSSARRMDVAGYLPEYKLNISTHMWNMDMLKR